jgi:hypothetical protein
MSRSESLRFRNSCLFLHSCWLAANPSLLAGGGGGSVTSAFSTSEMLDEGLRVKMMLLVSQDFRDIEKGLKLANVSEEGN